MFDSDKIILDLCGGTGSWSQPYREAGYDVRLVTLPDSDVRIYKPPQGVYGVLAAPLCTDFAGSGAQYWPSKDSDGRTLKSLEIITHCLRIIIEARPQFWCLENPVGRLKRWTGNPRMYIQPWEYGDAYTKKTALWGSFNPPVKKPVQPIKVCSEGSWLMKLGGGIRENQNA